MVSVTSQLIEEVTAHAQSDSLDDAQEICADDSYFPKNLRKNLIIVRVNKLCCIKFNIIFCSARGYNVPFNTCYAV